MKTSTTPLTTFLSITWSACLASEKRPGHWLGLSERQRVNRLWDRLWRLARRHQVKLIAARAPEYDKTKGVHLHLALHLPDTAQAELIELVERATGAPIKGKAHLPDGTTTRRNGRPVKGVLAAGDMGAWLIQRNTRLEDDGGAAAWMTYGTKAPRSEHVESQFRLSGALKELARVKQTAENTKRP